MVSGGFFGMDSIHSMIFYTLCRAFDRKIWGFEVMLAYGSVMF